MKKIYYLILTIYRIIKYLLSNTKRYSHILFLVLINRPITILEIGVYTGKRATEMIEAAKVFNNKIEYYGFDLFEMMNDKILKKEFSKIPLSKKKIQQKLSKIADVKLFKGYTNKTLPKLKNKKIDFIFIDGGHAVNTIYSDWKNCKNFIKKNTIVVFDDYYLDDKKIIKKYGSNKVIDTISPKKFKKKLCKLTDSFNTNLSDKKLKFKIFYVKKIIND